MKKVHILLYTILVVAVVVLYSSYNSARTNCMELEAARDESHTHIIALNTQIQKLSKNIKTVESQLEKVQRERTSLVQKLFDRETELGQLSEANTELKNQAVEARERLEFARRCASESRYETAAQILGLPTCTLTDAQNHICSMAFTDSRGKSFSIGGPGASPDVASFISSLENGKTYTLPADFEAYQKRTQCTTKGQLFALKPITAAFTKFRRAYGTFVYKDDKEETSLLVGGRDAEPEVIDFLKTLEVGKSYALPDAFREYLKKRDK